MQHKAVILDRCLWGLAGPGKQLWPPERCTVVEEPQFSGPTGANIPEEHPPPLSVPQLTS